VVAEFNNLWNPTITEPKSSFADIIFISVDAKIEFTANNNTVSSLSRWKAYQRWKFNHVSHTYAPLHTYFVIYL